MPATEFHLDDGCGLSKENTISASGLCKVLRHHYHAKATKDAYFVKCDHETNPQADVNKGIVNIVVGFAPLKPAEFVIIKIQQMAGQIET